MFSKKISSSNLLNKCILSKNIYESKKIILDKNNDVEFIWSIMFVFISKYISLASPNLPLKIFNLYECGNMAISNALNIIISSNYSNYNINFYKKFFEQKKPFEQKTDLNESIKLCVTKMINVLNRDTLNISDVEKVFESVSQIENGDYVINTVEQYLIFLTSEHKKNLDSLIRMYYIVSKYEILYKNYILSNIILYITHNIDFYENETVIIPVSQEKNEDCKIADDIYFMKKKKEKSILSIIQTENFKATIKQEYNKKKLLISGNDIVVDVIKLDNQDFGKTFVFDHFITNKISFNEGHLSKSNVRRDYIVNDKFIKYNLQFSMLRLPNYMDKNIIINSNLTIEQINISCFADNIKHFVGLNKIGSARLQTSDNKFHIIYNSENSIITIGEFVKNKNFLDLNIINDVFLLVVFRIVFNLGSSEIFVDKNHNLFSIEQEKNCEPNTLDDFFKLITFRDWIKKPCCKNIFLDFIKILKKFIKTKLYQRFLKMYDCLEKMNTEKIKKQLEFIENL